MCSICRCGFNKYFRKWGLPFFIVAPLRRPHIPIEDIMKGKTTSAQINRITYSIEYIARLAMSPKCLNLPDDWEHISKEYPNLVKKVSSNSYLITFMYMYIMRYIFIQFSTWKSQLFISFSGWSSFLFSCCLLSLLRKSRKKSLGAKSGF